MSAAHIDADRINPDRINPDRIRARLAVQVSTFTLDVDLDLPGRGVSAISGPSGAGKTLLLRALAGLESARGRVTVNGAVWQDDAARVHVPTHRRALGYVFQEPSLFPHLSVRANLEFARKRAGGGDLDDTARRLGIVALLDRMPQKLSGGERQRVAIARALLSRPTLLLFDEPLAALDLAGRAEILPYLERLRDEVEIPMLYVTHVPEEAARLADHLVLLDQGRVLASGALQDALVRLDLAAAFGEHAAAVIQARVLDYDADERLLRLEFPGGTLLVPRATAHRGERLRCRIEARDVSLTLERQRGTSILNILPATVAEMRESADGAQTWVRLDVGGTTLLARITRRSCRALGLCPGKMVWAQIKGVALIG